MRLPKLTSAPKNKEISIGIGAILLMGLCLGLVSLLDGLFPFGLDQIDRQGVNLLSAILVFLVFWGLASCSSFAPKIRIPLNLDSVRASLVCCLGLFVLDFFLLQNRIARFQFLTLYAEERIGYILFLLIVLLVVAEVFFCWSRFSFPVLVVGLAGYATLVGLEMFSIPWLYADESHYISIIEAIDRFVGGLDPYQVFDESTEGPFTQLPGFWMLFFPVWIWEFDPRWINKIALFLCSLLVYLGAERSKRLFVAYLLVALMLLPYNVFDNSTYLGCLAFFSALTYFLLAREYYLFAMAAVGLSLTVSFFCWIIVPFALIYLLRKQPFLLWLLEVALMGLFAATLLVFFGWLYPESFFYCTVEVWSDTVDRNGFNIAFWLEQLIGRYGMVFLQVVSFLLFFFSFLRGEKRLSSLFIYTGFFAYFCVSLNHVVNNYVFPTICLMIIAGSGAEKPVER